MILPFFRQPGLVTKFSCFHCKPLFGIESGSVKGGDPRSRLYTLDGSRINPDHLLKMGTIMQRIHTMIQASSCLNSDESACYCNMQ